MRSEKPICAPPRHSEISPNVAFETVTLKSEKVVTNNAEQPSRTQTRNTLTSRLNVSLGGCGAKDINQVLRQTTMTTSVRKLSPPRLQPAVSKYPNISRTWPCLIRHRGHKGSFLGRRKYETMKHKTYIALRSMPVFSATRITSRFVQMRNYET